MEGDSWSGRLSSPASSTRYQSSIYSRSGQLNELHLNLDDMLMGFEEVDMNDDIKEEFPCPICSEYFDIVELCFHIDEQHPVEAKNGRKRKSRKGGSHSILSLLRKELGIGNLQSLLGGSSCIVSSSNPAPDPLLSSFILPMDVDFLSLQPSFSTETSSAKNRSGDIILERSVQTSPMSVKDKEEREKRCEFASGLLLSTILDDSL